MGTYSTSLRSTRGEPWTSSRQRRKKTNAATTAVHQRRRCGLGREWGQTRNAAKRIMWYTYKYYIYRYMCIGATGDGGKTVGNVKENNNKKKVTETNKKEQTNARRSSRRERRRWWGPRHRPPPLRRRRRDDHWTAAVAVARFPAGSGRRRAVREALYRHCSRPMTVGATLPHGLATHRPGVVVTVTAYHLRRRRRAAATEPRRRHIRTPLLRARHRDSVWFPAFHIGSLLLVLLLRLLRSARAKQKLTTRIFSRQFFVHCDLYNITL